MTVTRVLLEWKVKEDELPKSDRPVVVAFLGLWEMPAWRDFLGKSLG